MVQVAHKDCNGAFCLHPSLKLGMQKTDKEMGVPWNAMISEANLIATYLIEEEFLMLM